MPTKRQGGRSLVAGSEALKCAEVSCSGRQGKLNYQVTCEALMPTALHGTGNHFQDLYRDIAQQNVFLPMSALASNYKLPIQARNH